MDEYSIWKYFPMSLVIQNCKNYEEEYNHDISMFSIFTHIRRDFSLK